MSADTDSTIDTESRRTELEDILMLYGLGADCLVLVDGFDNEPLRASKCQKIARKIFIRKSISPEQKKAALDELRMFPENISELDDDWMFLKYVLLKYVCGIQQRWQPEHECVKWALYHMKRV